MKQISQEQQKEILELYTVQNKSVNYISKIFGVSNTTITKILKSKNIPIRDNSFYKSKYFDKHYFDNIDSEDKAYFLGFIYADGYVSKKAFGIKISVKDEYLLETLKQKLHSEHKIVHTIGTQTKYGKVDSCSISIVNKYFVDNLISKGVIYNKTGQITFPDETIVPEQFKRHFIRGYFDGNGSVYKSNSGVVVGFDGSEAFLSQILYELNKLFNTVVKVNKYKDRNCYYIKIGGNNHMRTFYNYLYEYSTIFLERKKIVFEKYLF